MIFAFKLFLVFNVLLTLLLLMLVIRVVFTIAQRVKIEKWKGNQRNAGIGRNSNHTFH